VKGVRQKTKGAETWIVASRLQEQQGTTNNVNVVKPAIQALA